MYKKILFVFAAVCLSLTTMQAQKRAELNRQMTQIKQSPMYLWAEATNEDIDKAFAEAQNGLNDAATDWIAMKLGSAQIKIKSTDTDKCANWLNTRRGQAMRTFIYCKKADLVSSKTALSKVILTPAERGEQVQEEPEVIIPPLPEAPNPKDVPLATTVVKPAPAPAKAVEAAPKAAEVAAPAPAFSKTVLGEILAAKDMYRMKDLFANYKDDPRFSYGKYEGGMVPNDCYLLFYDSKAQIKGVLHKDGFKVEDVASQTPTSLSSYALYRGYWFTVVDK